MGNLHKAYVTFGKRPEALKKLLQTQDNDIASFMELCRNGKWNASDIIEAATMSFDPLEEGFFSGIASSIAQAFSGARYRRSFYNYRASRYRSSTGYSKRNGRYLPSISTHRTD